MEKSPNHPCPKCSSIHVIPIIYGDPVSEVMEASDAGKAELGGCCLTGNNPDWYCKDCGNRW